MQEGHGARAVDQVDRATRAGAVRHVGLEIGGAPVGELAGRLDQRDRVADESRVDVDLGDGLLEAEQAGPVEDLARRRRGDQRAGDDLRLVGRVRVVEQDLEHEPVDLGLGEGIRALGLDRVLGGQDKERGRHLERVVTDRDLVLLHDLEQRGLDLGGRPVDLVGEQEVGEDGALFDVEAALVGAVDAGADEVGRHQVRGELDPLEGAAEDLGEGLDGQRLGQAGDALEEEVAAAEQADEDSLEHLVLADDDPPDLEHDRFGGGPRVGRIGQGAEVGRRGRLRRPRRRGRGRDRVGHVGLRRLGVRRR